jgi:hypothetical protein
MVFHALAAGFMGFLMMIGSVFGFSHTTRTPSQTSSSTNSVSQTQTIPTPSSEVEPSNSSSVTQTTSAQTSSPSSSASNVSSGATSDSTLPTGSPWLSVLPLGDYKYVTSAPKKGFVYLCHVASGGEGAQSNGPWIQGNVWYPAQKTSVEGAVSWPNALIHIVISGAERIITTNDLPMGATTGTFPIQSSDPAYQYDTNPNSIQAQNLSFSLPANPTIASAPSCIYGEVGVMTNGVLLLDAFDAEYRDAEAHEMQDSCSGHPHMDGMYHYHSLSACITDIDETHVIGWAFDGFPITGPKLPSGNYLTTSDLDECHGITSPIIEDGETVDTYHYVMTQDFPYSVGCFRGTSYEPKPTPMTDSGSGMSGGGSMGGSGGMDMPPGPPPGI